MDMIQGAMKWVEENVGIPLEDTIDNVFQGNQRTPEQVAKDRAGQRQQNVQSFEGQKTINDLPGPLKPAAQGIKEVGSTIAGGATGAAETVLNTAEVVGDTARYFATLGRVRPNENPFNSKYEWAQWDLGRSEVGAQTGVGKVAQGFIEFGLLMAGTGGFANLPGAAAKFSQAATTLGKLKVITQAGAFGAIHGLPADLMSATRLGTGNLSNLIKENAPDWYPAWATALAVDDKDSPWEAMLKTGLEGMGLGFAADAAGAYLAGNRALRQAVKAGREPSEAVQAATRAAEEYDAAATAARASRAPEVPPMETRLPEVDTEALYQRLIGGEDMAAREEFLRLDAPTRQQLFDRVSAYGDDLNHRTLDIQDARARAINDAAEYERLGSEYDTAVEQAYKLETQRRDLGSRVSVQDQLNKSGHAERFVDLGDGANGRFGLVETDALVDGTKTYEVTWSASSGAGGPAMIRMRSAFRQIASELEPGTILRNIPADDGSGRGGASAAQVRRAGMEVDAPNIRARIYEHMGFGKIGADGEQWAVVRQTPGPNGRLLEPAESIGDISRVKQKLLLEDRSAGDFGSLAQYDREAMREVTRKANNGQWDTLPDEIQREVEAQYARLGERINSDRALAQQKAAGIPITWDDIADSEKAYFTPGARDVTQGFNPGLGKFIEDNPDGFSVDPFALSQPEGGFMVAIDGASLRGVDPESLDRFLTENADVLSREDAMLGGWKDGDDYVVEISRWIPERNEAVYLAKKFDQKAVFDLNEFKEINTGGKDLLKDSKDAHLRSAMGQAPEVTTVDPTTSAVQRLRADDGGLGPRGGAQPTVTNNWLRRFANGRPEAQGRMMRELIRNNPVQMSDLAKAADMNVEEIIAKAQKGIEDALDIPSGQVDFSKILRQQVGEDELLTMEGVVQVNGLIHETADRLYQSAERVMQLGENGMDAFPQVEMMADQLKGLLAIHKESAAAYSHLLYSHNLRVPGFGDIQNPFKPNTAQDLVKSINQINKELDSLVKKMITGDPAAQREAMRLANALLLAEGDPSKITKLSQYIREITKNEALAVMYNSMLSGPKTHLVNTMSNAVNTVYRPLAAFVGGDVKTKKAAIASFYNIHQTLGEAFDMAARTMKDGPVNDGGKMILRDSELMAKLPLLHRAAELSDDVAFKAGVGFMDMVHGIASNPIFNWPSKFLAAEDEFFKTVVGRMEYNARTMERAIEESAGTGSPVKSIFESMLRDGADDAFDPLTGAIKDDALMKAAKDITFQTDLEGWAQRFGSFVEAVPILKPFFPFVKVGHNIMAYAGTHVPVLGTYLKEYQTVMKGDDAYAKAVMKGRQAFGSALVAFGAMNAFQGRLTGNGPADPQERENWLKTHQPRSILVGKKWVEYGRLEPFGMLLSGVADLTAMTQAGQLSEDRASYLAGYLTYAIAANFTNKSYMQGVVPLGRILTPGWQGTNTLASLPAEIANNFVPLSGARRTMANALTPYKQEFNGLLDRLAFTASGGVFKGAKSYDWLDGKEVQSGTGGFLNSVLPTSITPRKTDKVRDALEDIEFDSSIILKTISGVKLGREHKSRLAQLMGQGNLHAELEQYVTHKDFQPARKAFIERLMTGERVYKENEPFYRDVVNIIERHRDMALEQLKMEFPDLNAQILDRQIIRAEQQQQRSQEEEPIDFEHLVNMPIK
jgi:hypothetical protein